MGTGFCLLANQVSCVLVLTGTLGTCHIIMPKVIHTLAAVDRVAVCGSQRIRQLVLTAKTVAAVLRLPVDRIACNADGIYVDQWDWEKVIDAGDRNVSYLKRTVRDIVGAIVETNDALGIAFPSLHTKLSRDVFFITTQELEDKYPDLTPKQREDAICREHGTVFLMQIGLTLHSGIKHDGRAPDYDDWTLNGDLLFWNDVLGRAFEISSMGIRVSPESLDHQLTVSGCDDRRELPFHKMLLAGELPLTMGGGIGQSRLCMLMIGTAHIGEVQVSLWDDDTLKACADAGILLL